ncbi:hypothetical protein [Desulfamplus magnetovallimortis]|uniref:hypothetical protein n=1 Tax=Desulfamplus magnetovallimortis TaxID=1246637 RepID=UPI0009BC21FB|nr:hypothetical protein [Desulfamplus magnetovallimortis]
MKFYDINKQWEDALHLTEKAVNRHPEAYRELKKLIHRTVSCPLDIRDYFTTAEKIVNLLSCLDPCGQGSIFHRFSESLAPSNIWHVKWMRVECLDLLDHLDAFDRWRREKRKLRIVK